MCLSCRRYAPRAIGAEGHALCAGGSEVGGGSEGRAACAVGAGGCALRAGGRGERALCWSWLASHLAVPCEMGILIAIEKSVRNVRRLWFTSQTSGQT